MRVCVVYLQTSGRLNGNPERAAARWMQMPLVQEREDPLHAVMRREVMWIICCGLHTQSHCSHQHHPWHREFRWLDSAPVTFYDHTSYILVLNNIRRKKKKKKKEEEAASPVALVAGIKLCDTEEKGGHVDVYIPLSFPPLPWKCPLTSTTSRSIVISSCFFSLSLQQEGQWLSRYLPLATVQTSPANHCHNGRTTSVK